MSKLESSVKPILSKLIRLEKMKFSQEEQNLVAFWSQKTILILNQSTPGGIKITKDLYEEIYRTKSYSKKVMVKIG